jgi:hypothetical protein
MSLLYLTKAGLSALEIDVNKDWQGMSITKVKELVSGMQKGDLLFFDGNRLAKSTPGPIGTVLTGHDIGADPTWEYPP